MKKLLLILVLGGLVAAQSGASIAFVRAGTDTSTSATSRDVVVTGIGAGNTLVVAVGLSIGGSSTITSSGITWTRDVNQTHNVGDTLDIHSAYIAAGGSVTLHIVVSSATAIRTVWVEYSGIAPSSRVVATSGAQGTSSSVNAGSVTATANNLIFCAAKTDSDLMGPGPGNDWVPGSGFTLRDHPGCNCEPDQKLGVEDKIVSAGSFSGTFTINSDSWAAGVVAYAPASGAASDPTISVQPANQTAAHSQTATFSVTALGNTTLSYQWNWYGTNVTGATSSSWTTPALVVGNSGSSVFVTVADTAGSLQSSTATLTVTSDVAITTQPQNQSVTVGNTATFTVVATGGSTLHYQWRFNGGIVGTDSSAYNRLNCQLADSGGQVRVTVSDTLGQLDSNTATLSVSSGGGTPSAAPPGYIGGGGISGGSFR